MHLPEDYRNDEGILICGVCGKPKEVKFNLMGFERTVPCLCNCGAKERDDIDEAWATKQNMIRVSDMRIENIRDKERRNSRFETAEMTPNLMKCKKYVDNWKEVRVKNAGLMMWGTCGNGKSFAAACIANALIDQGIPALMTSFPAILSDNDNTVEVAKQMQKFELVILDDLGAERQSEYAMEKVFYIIDERYKSHKPLIVTTNQPLALMKQYRSGDDMTYSRIYDRLFEMCTPMMFETPTRRIAPQQEKEELLRTVLA